ncbi:MAG: hypothetical protein AAFX50_20415 [Acidobacteriota bacterium]
MVMCRPALNASDEQATPAASRNGGPVFVPRRKPSALAENLLAELRNDVTPYDELGFAGRPVS